MKRSSDRIITTHTNSLPRPVELAALVEAQEAGEQHDAERLAASVRAAVAEFVEQYNQSWRLEKL